MVFPEEAGFAELVRRVESSELTLEEALGHAAQSLRPLEAGPILVLRGLPAAPGRGTGRVVVDVESALEHQARGEPFILLAAETTPDHVEAMHAAAGIITERGGLTSHAAVVARSIGRPAVVGARGLSALVSAGDPLSIDGQTGEIFSGGPAASAPPEAIETLLSRAAPGGPLPVRAVARTFKEAMHAFELGAEGLGAVLWSASSQLESSIELVAAVLAAAEDRTVIVQVEMLDEAVEEALERVARARPAAPPAVQLRGWPPSPGRGVLVESSPASWQPKPPFVALDMDRLALSAAEELVKGLRREHPEITLSAQGDLTEESVAFCHRLRLDYLSCPAHRVLVTRLWAAKAAVRS